MGVARVASLTYNDAVDLPGDLDGRLLATEHVHSLLHVGVGDGDVRVVLLILLQGGVIGHVTTACDYCSRWDTSHVITV